MARFDSMSSRQPGDIMVLRHTAFAKYIIFQNEIVDRADATSQSTKGWDEFFEAEVEEHVATLDTINQDTKEYVDRMEAEYWLLRSLGESTKTMAPGRHSLIQHAKTRKTLRKHFLTARKPQEMLRFRAEAPD